jgi:hypothetical protein
MKISREKSKTDDIKKVKNYLIGLGFVCNSHPLSQNLIYSKDEEVIIVKNNKK